MGKNKKERTKQRKEKIRLETEKQVIPDERIDPALLAYRKAWEKHTRNEKPHCVICGDTQEQCPLVRFNNSSKLLCEDCVRIQKNMFP
jgi:hypothetical protein